MKKSVCFGLKVIVVMMILLTTVSVEYPLFSTEMGLNVHAETANAVNYTITAVRGVNLRSGPGIKYRRLSGIPYGETMLVTEVSDDGMWGKTEHNGKTGWFCLVYSSKHDSLDTVKSGLYTIRSTIESDTTMVVDLANADTTSGTVIWLYHYNDTNAQKYYISYVSDGYYAIYTSCDRDMVMAVGSSKMDSPTVLVKYDGSDTQLWKIVPETDGNFSIISKCSGFCLDVFNAEPHDRNTLQAHRMNGTAAQRWQLIETELAVQEQSGIGEKLDVPIFRQYDGRWKNQKIGNKSIGSVGCLLCSVSMLHSYSTGETITPNLMKTKLAFDNNSLLWGSVEKYGYVHTSYYKKINNTILCSLYDNLAEGKPVVIGGRNGSKSHWVIVTGYSEKNKDSLSADKFYINDPGNSKRNILDDFLEDYPTVIATLC